MFDPKTHFFQQDAFLKVSILICILLNHVTRRMFSSGWLLSSAFLLVMSSVKITLKLVTSTLVVTQPVDTYSSTKVPTILVSIELFSSETSHVRPRSTTLALISSLRRMSEGFRSLCIKLWWADPRRYLTPLAISNPTTSFPIHSSHVLLIRIYQTHFGYHNSQFYFPNQNNHQRSKRYLVVDIRPIHTEKYDQYRICPHPKSDSNHLLKIVVKNFGKELWKRTLKVEITSLG